MTFNIWTFLFEGSTSSVLAFVLHRLLYRPLQQGHRPAPAGQRPRPDRGDKAGARGGGALQAATQRSWPRPEENARTLLRKAAEQAEAERGEADSPKPDASVAGGRASRSDAAVGARADRPFEALRERPDPFRGRAGRTRILGQAVDAAR